MTEARVIKATFSEWRMIKTRKVLQLILEVPLEQQGDVLTRLGAPMPDQEKWVAVALLDELVASETEHQQKAKDLSRSLAGKERHANADKMEQARTRAALLPKDPRFRLRWGCRSEDAAVDLIRRVIDGSRSRIATDPDAYERFIEFEQRDIEATPGRLAEVRG